MRAAVRSVIFALVCGRCGRGEVIRFGRWVEGTGWRVSCGGDGIRYGGSGE